MCRWLKSESGSCKNWELVIINSIQKSQQALQGDALSEQVSFLLLFWFLARTVSFGFLEFLYYSFSSDYHYQWLFLLRSKCVHYFLSIEYSRGYSTVLGIPHLWREVYTSEHLQGITINIFQSILHITTPSSFGLYWTSVLTTCIL